MTPDDPRHGKTYGWKLHRLDGEEPCAACRAAVAEYEYRRSIDQLLGRPRAVPSRGVRRRIEALQALGWSFTAIGEQMGMAPALVHRAMTRPAYSTSAMQARVAAAYEAMSMSVPTDPYANRRRMLAARKGYVPPLAWDDIDADDEPWSDDGEAVVDEVAIERALRGVDALALERHERVEAVKRHLAGGGTRTSFERLTGIAARRYLDDLAAPA